MFWIAHSRAWWQCVRGICKICEQSFFQLACRNVWENCTLTFFNGQFPRSLHHNLFEFYMDFFHSHIKLSHASCQWPMRLYRLVDRFRNWKSTINLTSWKFILRPNSPEWRTHSLRTIKKERKASADEGWFLILMSWALTAENNNERPTEKGAKERKKVKTSKCRKRFMEDH